MLRAKWFLSTILIIGGGLFGGFFGSKAVHGDSSWWWAAIFLSLGIVGIFVKAHYGKKLKIDRRIKS